METEIFKMSESSIDEAALSKASKSVDSGALAAFPTETVYGIACRANDESIAKLNILKGRGKDKFYTLVIPDAEKCSDFVVNLDLRARKLMNNFWPGPLTIVFEMSDEDIAVVSERLDEEIVRNLYKNNSIGIRCPDNAISRALLSKCVWPVVAPSANKTDSRPAVNAGQVIEEFSGQLEIIIDGGECKLQKPSTVVKIGSNGIEILRAGAIEKVEIIRSSTANIVFVCSGNSCRSPMAEGIMKKKLSEKLKCNVDELLEKGYKVTSAGTMGINGAPATVEAVNACMDMGCDISGHVSTGLTSDIVAESDYIFVMSNSHYRQVLGLCPEAVTKCFLLWESEIDDPIGRDQPVYDCCAELIEKAILKRMSEFWT